MFPEYAVKVYGSNVTLLAERDFLSLSDIHSHMFPKVQRSTTLTLSEPFPLIISGEEDTHKMVRALFTVVLFGVPDLTVSSVGVCEQFRKVGYLMMLAVRDPALGEESRPEVLEQATVGYVRSQHKKGELCGKEEVGSGDGGTFLAEVQVMGTVDFEKTIEGLEE